MLIAGIDVGNTTTEVIVVDAGVSPPNPLVWDRSPTRGAKGSAEALVASAMLLGRLERRLGRCVDLVAAAPQHPVETRTMSLPESAPRTGRLDVVPARGDTPGGFGLAAGTPVWAHTAPRRMSEPIVLLAPTGTGFRTTVDAVHAWTRLGNDVSGVLIADDEGVLVAARLDTAIPVADQVDVERAATALLVAFEVRPPGHTLQALADPIRLSVLLGLDFNERADAVGVADTIGDASRCVLAVHATALPARSAPSGAVLLRDQAEPRPLDPALLAQLGVGAVRRCTLPGWTIGQTLDVDDLWAVGLREVAASVATQVDSDTARAIVVAALRSGSTPARPDVVLGGVLDAPVQVIQGEAAAARAGALTTPGVRVGAVVADLGGGTIDVMGADGGDVVAAGAGEMLTAAVAGYLHLPLGAADWVKRAPCSRLESSHLSLAEDGTRTFLERPAPAAAVGSLVAHGPAGLLPFGGSLAAASWRALRLRLKQRVLGDNLVRALRSLGEDAQDVLLVGGAAGDEELLGLLRAALPASAVGRADVAAGLGHRYAVAYGLTVLTVS